MNGRRLKLLLILGGLLFGALAIVSWTQPWFALTLQDGQRVEADGGVAAPALSALGLASLALVAALSIAGRVFRVVLGVLETAIGVLVVVAASVALGDPVAASAQSVTDVTAMSGPDTIAALVATVTATAWPYLAAAAGALSAAVGVGVTVTSGRWPGATRKYETTAADDVTSTAGAWDALSEGNDPTAPISR